MPLSCEAACAKITVTLQVLNYNDVGQLNLYCSNTDSFDYGDPLSADKNNGWIGRIQVPQSFVSPGWKTVTFSLRLPHLEWLNDDGAIYIALLGPEYFQSGARAQFQVASSTIDTISWDADTDGDGDIDGSDLFELAADYGCTESCKADFDGDGAVTDGDLSTFIEEFSWFGCPLGFYENFDDGTADNWNRTAAWSVSDGVFKMNGIQGPVNMSQYAYHNQVYDDFFFQASVKQIEGSQGSSAGIFFRSNTNRSNHYAFLIASVGQYTILKVVNGALTQLVPWTPGNFQTGYNVWNKLGVSCSGSTLKFFINQTWKKTITDDSIASGVAGLYALDSNADVNVFHFDDVFLEKK